MRRGYTLTELMVLLAIMAVIAVPISRLTKVIIYDIPMSLKLVECNTSILNAMQVIGQDMALATAISKSDDGKLVIEQKGCTINYIFQEEEGRIIRNETAEQGEWYIPSGKIEWNVLEKNGKSYALEIKKYVVVERYSEIDKKMENSYLYFVDDVAEKVK